jgi:hypothetical protein
LASVNEAPAATAPLDHIGTNGDRTALPDVSAKKWLPLVEFHVDSVTNVHTVDFCSLL